MLLGEQGLVPREATEGMSRLSTLADTRANIAGNGIHLIPIKQMIDTGF